MRIAQSLSCVDMAASARARSDRRRGHSAAPERMLAGREAVARWRRGDGCCRPSRAAAAAVARHAAGIARRRCRRTSAPARSARSDLLPAAIPARPAPDRRRAGSASPAAPRSMRKSAGASRSTGAAPASIAKPILPGSSGKFVQPGGESLGDAVRVVARPPVGRDQDRRARVSRSGSRSTRPSATSVSISGRQLSSRTPRIWRLARLVTSIWPLPCADRRLAQAEHLLARQRDRAAGGRGPAGRRPPSSGAMRRAPAVDDEAAHAGRSSVARIELRRVGHRPAAWSAREPRLHRRQRAGVGVARGRRGHRRGPASHRNRGRSVRDGTTPARCANAPR